jgi:hypothetical protein
MLIAGVVLAGIVWGGGYVIACWIWPFAACRKCDGAGKFASPSGRAWRNCKRCKGSGKRVRGGVRVAEWFRGARKALD